MYLITKIYLSFHSIFLQVINTFELHMIKFSTNSYFSFSLVRIIIKIHPKTHTYKTFLFKKFKDFIKKFTFYFGLCK